MKGIGRGRGFLYRNRISPKPGEMPSGNTTDTIPADQKPGDTSDEAVDRMFQDFDKRLKLFSGREDANEIQHKYDKFTALYWSYPYEERLSDKELEMGLTCTCVAKIWQYSRNLYSYLYSRCKKDDQVVNRCSKLLEKLWLDNDRKFTKIFLTSLQNDYENRIQIKEQSLATFRNYVKLITLPLQIEKYHPILITPIVDLCCLLLESDDETDAELVTAELKFCGPILLKSKSTKEEYHRLINAIRNRLVTGESLTKKYRTWLLLCVDLHHLKFGDLPINLYTFYEDTLDGYSLVSVLTTPQPNTIAEPIQAAEPIEPLNAKKKPRAILGSKE